MIYYLSDSNFNIKTANVVHVINQTKALAEFDRVRCFCFGSPKLNNELSVEFFSVSSRYTKLSLVLYFIFLWKERRRLVKARKVYTRSFVVSCLLILLRVRHELELHAMSHRYFKFFIKSTLIKRITVITKGLQTDLFSKYGMSSTVLPDAAAINEYVDEIKDNFVLYTGSAKKGKGVEVVIELAKFFSETRFVLCGPTIEELADKNITSNVEITGYLDSDQVQKYQAQALVALLPNSKDVIMDNGVNIGKYTSPLKLFEYMAAKSLIIYSDLDVLNEILDDSCAVKARVDDLSDWIEKLSDVLLNYNLYQSKVERAYQLYLMNYTWRIRAAKILNIDV